MLKEGDIVKIKQLNLRELYPSGVCGDMLRFSGKIAIISRIVAKNNYRISNDENEYSWNKEMFEDSDNPHQILSSELPLEIFSNIFGVIILENINNDQDYPYDIRLKDGDIISVTKDFKYFKESNKSIF